MTALLRIKGNIFRYSLSLAFGLSLAACSLQAATTNYYHSARTFTPVAYTAGVTTVYSLMVGLSNITGIVKSGTNVIFDTNASYAVEYESLALGYASPESAWQAVSTNFSSNARTHAGQTYDNTGWVKGTYPAHGTWGGFLWFLENHATFKTSPTNFWISASGVTNLIDQVMVGTVGDYQPMTNAVGVGPTNWASITNYLGSGGMTDIICKADFNTYYKLRTPEVGIAMDGNRDDIISFSNTNDNHYLFWVNNDFDTRWQNTGDSGSPWQEDDLQLGTQGRTNSDCMDSIINCKRDLEDFTQLHIKVDNNTANLPGITYFLKFENINGTTPSVNIFEAVGESSGYLSDTNVASQQIMKTNLLTVTTTEQQLPSQYIKTNNLVSPFILEGRHEGKGNLVFIVKKNGQEICRKTISLELHEMPWFYDVFTVGVTSGDQWAVEIQTNATHSQTASYEPSTDEKFLLVHGWNMSENDKTNYSETAFKRLWWQGYHGSVAAFNWPTLSGINGFWDVVGNPGSFDNSEFRSWLSSDALIGVFNNLNSGGNKLRVMAHSMGNVVTSEAIHRYNGANLHTYIACQAAFSAQYYDNGVALTNPCQNQAYGSFPNTPDIMGHSWTGDSSTNSYMMNGSIHVSNLQNYFNSVDWALDLWEINNVLRPDNVLYLFSYYGSLDHYNESTDRFFRGPLNDPYEILLVEVQRDSYSILSYCAESRSRALGQTMNGKFHNWNLHDDISAGGMGYDQYHYSHSREFRSNVADEWLFWGKVFETCQFTHL